MKIGFVSNHNPLDRRTFSGTSYYMYRALCENSACSTRLLGNHRHPNRFINRLYRALPDQRAPDPESFGGVDVILSLASTDLVSEYSSLTKVPIIHCTDATPGFLREFYNYDIPDALVEEERNAYDRAKLILFSSDFMLERAISEYGDEYRAKMRALTWGANLDSFPMPPHRKPPLRPLRLLFMGRDWVRKGGDIAIATLLELRRRGINAELHLVGVDTTQVKPIEGVMNHGYLDKNRSKDQIRLQEVLSKIHFLILPTRGDCTPMVVAEVNSYGIPVLITDVGGIPSLMHPGQNGEMLPLDADSNEYANRLLALSDRPQQYEALSRSSFEHFQNNLTWASWSSAFIKLIEERFAYSELAI